MSERIPSPWQNVSSPDFWRGVIPAVLGAVLLVLIVLGGFMWRMRNFDECRTHGFSVLYCVGQR